MSTASLPTDLSECPLWRLLVLLDDLEREYGASSPDARRVARTIANRLGVVSPIEPDRADRKVVADAAR